MITNLICFVLGTAFGLGIWRLVARIDRLLLDREECMMRRQEAMIGELRRASAKTDTSHTEKNGLANETDMPDNPSVKSGTTTGSARDSSKPFWDDPEQLKQARDRIIAADETPDEADLMNLTPVEQWQKLDARIMELQTVDIPE